MGLVNVESISAECIVVLGCIRLLGSVFKLEVWMYDRLPEGSTIPNSFL